MLADWDDSWQDQLEIWFGLDDNLKYNREDYVFQTHVAKG